MESRAVFLFEQTLFIAFSTFAAKGSTQRKQGLFSCNHEYKHEKDFEFAEIEIRCSVNIEGSVKNSFLSISENCNITIKSIICL